MSDLALFDLEPPRRPIVLTPPDAPFIPTDGRLCGMCRKPMKRLSWTHGCGMGSGAGSYVICDDCAPDDHLPGTTRSRWGITREFLAIDRMRRKVYAAGGGETEVHAALVEAGLVAETPAGPAPCGATWIDHHDAVPHDEHQCVFVASTVDHSRHECRCGINAHEVTA